MALALKKMPRRRKNLAIREMRKEQSKTNHVIPLAPFVRIVQTVARDMDPNIRFKKDAIDALHTDTEAFVIETLHRANCLAVSCGRQTLTERDLKLLHRLEGRSIT